MIIRYILPILLLSFSLQAQITDLARVEYTYFPQKQSKNSFKRFRTLVNLPVKLNNKGAYLVPGIEYRNVRFDYEDSTVFDVTNLDNFHSFRFTLGYTFKMENYWRFAIKSGVLLASNFEGEGVTRDDILFSGSVFLIKDRKDNPGPGEKPWRLVLGLQYSTTAGRPIPLPFVNYYKEFHPSWSYSLGIPKSNIRYYATDKHVFQGFATLDGFFANIQDKRVIPIQNGTGHQTAQNISMTVALAGLGYEYCFTKHLSFHLYGGHTLLNDIRLRNENGEDVFTINDKNSLYGRTGIKFKI